MTRRMFWIGYALAAVLGGLMGSITSGGSIVWTLLGAAAGGVLWVLVTIPIEGK